MTTFHSMGLNNNLLQAIDGLGFATPTPVQEKAIPELLNTDRDLIALAQTGTGKTAAFGIPILEQLNTDTRAIQAIILCPTRELCLQITRDLITYAQYMPDVKIQPVYGGADVNKQIRGLRKNPQIVVGTPGRTLDLIQRGALKINHITWVVLDEADEMLNMGFRDDINAILKDTPKEKKTLLFSATMPKDMRKIVAEYMVNPIEISIGRTNQGATNVEHHFYTVRGNQRYSALKRIADTNPDMYGIVFCRTRRGTKDVARTLMKDGYNADAIHGDLSQAQRDSVMGKFRKKRLQFLVATDVASRGIDIDELTHVINYNLPDDPEIYIHRSGRTGRAGNTGESIILATSGEGRKIKEIEKLMQKKITSRQIPSREEAIEKQISGVVHKIRKMQVDDALLQPYMESIGSELKDLERDELLKRLISMQLSAPADSRESSSDVFSDDFASRDHFKSRNGNDRMSSTDFTRFHLGIGGKQRIKPLDLIGLINDATGKRDIEIGKIEILKNFSFFEADSKYEKLILDSFKETNLIVQIAKSSGRKSGKRRKRR